MQTLLVVLITCNFWSSQRLQPSAIQHFLRVLCLHTIGICSPAPWNSFASAAIHDFDLQSTIWFKAGIKEVISYLPISHCCRGHVEEERVSVLGRSREADWIWAETFLSGIRGEDTWRRISESHPLEWRTLLKWRISHLFQWQSLTTSPCWSAVSAYHPAMPKWFEFFATTHPMPCSRAYQNH